MDLINTFLPLIPAFRPRCLRLIIDQAHTAQSPWQEQFLFGSWVNAVTVSFFHRTWGQKNKQPPNTIPTLYPPRPTWQRGLAYFFPPCLSSLTFYHLLCKLLLEARGFKPKFSIKLFIFPVRRQHSNRTNSSTPATNATIRFASDSVSGASLDGSCCLAGCDWCAVYEGDRQRWQSQILFYWVFSRSR